VDVGVEVVHLDPVGVDVVRPGDEPERVESFPRKQAFWNVSFGSGQTSWPRMAGLSGGRLYAEAGTLAAGASIGINASAVAAVALAR